CVSSPCLFSVVGVGEQLLHRRPEHAGDPQREVDGRGVVPLLDGDHRLAAHPDGGGELGLRESLLSPTPADRVVGAARRGGAGDHEWHVKDPRHFMSRILDAALRRRAARVRQSWSRSSVALCPRGSSWSVECSTSKCPSRQCCSSSRTTQNRSGRSTSSSTTTWAETTGTPEVIVQAWRSWTVTTPSTSHMCSRRVARDMSSGVPSSSTRATSRRRKPARG